MLFYAGFIDLRGINHFGVKLKKQRQANMCNPANNIRTKWFRFRFVILCGGKNDFLIDYLEDGFITF